MRASQKYDIAWSYLSPNFKARQEDRGGYNGYIKWWSTIDAVSIKKLELVEGDRDKIYVHANLKYFRTKKKDFSHLLQLSCVWDEERNRWAIDNTKVLSNS